MNVITQAVTWMFAPQQQPIRWWRVILWWELRRFPFNLCIGIYGAVCLVLFFWAITTSGHLQPGEDAFEPIALIAAPIVANACYTLGWLLETLVRVLMRDLSPRFSPVLLKIGLGFSFFIVGVPAAVWIGYRLLQILQVVR